MSILHNAAREKNMQKLLLGISRDIDGDLRVNKLTALHIAAKNGWVEGVKALSADNFKKNCDLDLRDENGDTALNLAIKNGHTDVVKVLLEARSGNPYYQVDPDVLNNSGDNSALIAAKSGNADALQMIMSSGRINPYVKDINGDTVLHIVAKLGMVESIQSILELHDGFLNIKNNAGDTPISAAIHAHQHDAAKYIAEFSIENSDDYYNFATTDSSGLTAAQAAHLEGWDDVEQILVGGYTPEDSSQSAH